jgi:glc operon protein GlcG
MKSLKTTLLFLTFTAFVLVLARAAVFTTPLTEVTLIPADKVAAGFVKGVPLLQTPEYKIHAGRRDVAGEAEQHAGETDIFHILEGSATFVTGGAIANPRTESPGELRGKQINGGKPQQLKKGDVIVIPAGVPHWFKEVNGPLHYFVVKVLHPAKK